MPRQIRLNAFDINGTAPSIKWPPKNAGTGAQAGIA